MGASSSSGGITVEDGKRLLESHVPRNDDSFWGKFWGAESRADVWFILDPMFLRALMERRPENLYTLTLRTVEHLETLITQKYKLKHEQIQETIACVRVLTRCVQVINEDSEALFENRYLWVHQPPLPRDPPPQESKESTHSETDAMATEEGKAIKPPSEGDTKSAAVPQEKDSKKTGGEGPSLPAAPEPMERVLAERIISLLYQLMFVPGLTVEPSADVLMTASGDMIVATSAILAANAAAEGQDPNGVYKALLWESGLEKPSSESGDTTAAVSSSHDAGRDSNRTVVLECILVCLSRPLFTPPNLLVTRRNRWAEAFVRPGRALAATLFFSLLNVATNFHLPTSSLYSFLTTYADQRIELVDVSLQVLLVLLDHRSIMSARDSKLQSSRRSRQEKNGPKVKRSASEIEAGVMDIQGNSKSSERKNVFMTLFKNLRNPKQIKEMYNCICRLLNACQEGTGYFALDPLECFQECFVLLWKLLEENSVFLSVIVTQCDVLALVRPVLYFMYECRHDASKLGLLYSCVFILLRLSGEREFCVVLNEDYDGSLPVSLPVFKGTHADLLILICQKVVVSSAEHLNSMLNGVLTVISNCSPYLTSLSMISSVKLLNLFELVTNPKYLYSAPHHPSYVGLMLDIFNNLIQYQYAGCPDLVYAILRRSKLFYSVTKIPAFLEGEQSNDNRESKSTDTRPVAQQVVEEMKGKDDDDPPPARDPPALQQDTKDTKEELKKHSNDKTNGNVKEKAQSDGRRPPEPAAAAETATTKRFRPTKQWVSSWQRKLPLGTVLRLIDFMLPKLHDRASNELLTSTDELLKVIKSTTLVGVLPAPHPIVVNKYIPNPTTTSWFSTFLWGIVYLRNVPLFARDSVQLFPVYDIEEDEEDV